MIAEPLLPTTYAQQQLKQSLLALIAIHGYGPITITDITKHAELSRTAFYNNYHSKRELLEDLVEDMQDGFLHAVKVSFDHANRVDFSLYPTMLPVLQYVEKNAPLFDFLYSPSTSPKALISFYTFLSSSYTTEITFTPKLCDSINGVDTAQYLALATLSFIGYWVESRYKYSVVEMDEQLQQLHKEKSFSWYFAPSAFARNSCRSKNSAEDRRIARTRSAIKAGLLSLLDEQMPVDHITIKDIADRANIRRATFYDHYFNRTHLMEQMIDDFGIELIQQLIVEEQASPLRSTIAACEKVFNYVLGHRVFLRILDNPNTSLLFIVRMRHLLREHYKTSQVHVSFDQELYAHYVSGVMLELILSQTHFIDMGTSPRLSAEKFVRLISQKEYQIAML